MREGYDIDGVITMGIYPGNPEDVIITGRSLEEMQETIELLESLNITNRVYYNPSVNKTNKSFKTSANWKSNIINQLDIQVFYEDEPAQAEIITSNCPRCIVKLITNKSNELLQDALQIQKSYYNGKIGKSDISNDINDFTYHVYNHPDAPMFMPRDDYEIIILMSGGIDSFVAYHYAKSKFNNVKGLYIDYGYPYAKVEREAIKHLGIDMLPYEDHSYLTDIQKEGENLWGEIFPGRNWILSIIASKYIKSRGEIWMAAIGGEVKELWGDKSEYYFTNASRILSNQLNKSIRVTTPFKNFTKGQLVEWYIQQGLSVDLLKKTVSCHYITEYNQVPCGECMGCAHRFVGMSYNNIIETHEKDVKAFTKKLYTKEINNSLSEFSPQRLKEIKSAIE